MSKYLEQFRIMSSRHGAAQHSRDRLSPAPERYHGDWTITVAEALISWVIVVVAALILVAIVVVAVGR